MKSQKGMSQITLVISIIVIIVIGVLGLNISKRMLETRNIENYKTNMLLLQGKVKVISKEFIMNKEDEEILKGKKVSENLENEDIVVLLEKNIISQDEENFEKYYIIENEDLEKIGLSSIKLEEGYYVVNYNTYEVIYSKGIDVEKEKYYKLSEIKEINNKEENNQINIVEDKTETETETESEVEE